MDREILVKEIMMKKEINKKRILSRNLAKELSEKELENVNGGTTSICGSTCGCDADDCDMIEV
jgi:bacteriocin-like protein